MSRWLKRWNWGGPQIPPDLPRAMAEDSTNQRPFRAVRVVPIAGPPPLICPNQRTYSDIVQVENEPRAGARICA
jgi:hypothetical protein